jgi:polysaccharide deacetylase family protein (PEP-CTERM system associated)
MQTTLNCSITGSSPAEAAVGRSKRAIQCAFTVDVEDWYQSSVDFDAPITDRVVRNVERLLTILDTHSVKGTFFVQGMVAEKFPKLMEVLRMEGHEIQSHGHSHRPLYGMTSQELKRELEFSRKTVEDACGVRVTAFRAPDFSILQRNLWALDALAEAGFKVDSSIFPMKMKRYGIKGWEAEPKKVQLKNGGSIWEVPVAIWNKGGIRIPIAGGGYFRLLPHAILRRALHSMVQKKQMVILYCHPYEFSNGELRAYRNQVPRRFLFTQNLGREAFVKRVSSLMQEFSFGRFDEILSSRGIA